jgi:class 3 adenylate cyclase
LARADAALDRPLRKRLGRPTRHSQDHDWHALLDAHDAIVRAQLARFRGREVNTAGDGFLAMFDGPQRAIRCAMSIRDAVQALGIEVRAGLHVTHPRVRSPRR